MLKFQIAIIFQYITFFYCISKQINAVKNIHKSHWPTLLNGSATLLMFINLYILTPPQIEKMTKVKNKDI